MNLMTITKSHAQALIRNGKKVIVRRKRGLAVRGRVECDTIEKLDAAMQKEKGVGVPVCCIEVAGNPV
jgi:hypothetical protein